MLKKLKWILIFSLIILIEVAYLADKTIDKSTNNFIYYDCNKIPQNRVGLLLGTSRFLSNGNPNQYFINRIKATVNLYNSHKIEYIVISGDNSTVDYNEPLDMKNELIKAGIPADKIYLDYAGFRTYDSVIRLEKIFGQKKFTVISQEFHNRRAIYIANRLNMQAIGYNARDVDVYNGFKTKLREKFSRILVFVDLMINKQPKFLGEQIEIK